MKKLLLLTLLIPSLLFGQMTIENHPQAPFFSWKLDYTYIKSPVANKRLLIFLPGSGEMGKADGTMLYQMTKYSFPKFAAAGTIYPFDILCIQPKNYAGIESNFLAWVQEEFQPESIIVMGISLGAIQTDKLLYLDTYKHIDAFVSLSGKGFPDQLDLMAGIPGYIWHGEADATVTLRDDKKFYEPYQAKFSNLTIVTAPGVGHSGWDMASDQNMLNWIINHFTPEPEPLATYSDVYNKVVADIITKLSDQN